MVAVEPLGEFAEQGGADPNDDGEHQDLDAGGHDVAEDPLGQKRRLVEQTERNQDETRERRELELDQRDEELWSMKPFSISWTSLPSSRTRPS